MIHHLISFKPRSETWLIRQKNIKTRTIFVFQNKIYFTTARLIHEQYFHTIILSSNKMTDHLISSNHLSQGQQHSVNLFDSPRITEFKNESLLQRFKHNQIQLKNKFKSYITSQKLKYPLVHKRIKTETQFEEDQQQKVNVRAIRKQKKRLTQELQTSMNESKYLEKKRTDNQKTFYQLKEKYEKVVGIREQRKEEVQKIQKAIKQISEEIYKEKLKYHRDIEESRLKLAKSRIICEREKFSLAEKTRREAEENMKHVSQEKNQQISMNKLKCETVRENQKLAQLTVYRLKKIKRDQAEEVKVQRLMRQLAEKQEIKIASSRYQELSNSRGKTQAISIKVLDSKIRHFRKSLGERRLSPPVKMKVKLPHKHGRDCEQFEQSSTNGGFPFSVKRRSFTQEAVQQN